MNRIGFLFISSILLLSVSSCQNKVDSEKEGDKKGNLSSEIATGGLLKLAISDEVKSINPKNVYSVHASQVTSMVYEPIVKFNPKTLEIEGLIAESFEIADSNKTFTFTIRDGVMFHDDECFPNGKGRALTAEDVKHSYEYYCKKENGEMSVSYNTVFSGNVVGLDEYISGDASEISGIRAEGNKVIIKLYHSNADFLKQLASSSASILAKEVIECKGLDRGAGTGPFILKDNSKREIVLIKNQNYYLITSNNHY